MKIGLISDTHSFIHPRLFHHLQQVDEIWHAGDVGSIETLQALQDFKPFRGVFGNIDGSAIRKELPEHLHFECCGLQVYITHIGGYPGKYDSRAFSQILTHKPGLFIAGHSHICKVQFDKSLHMLHMNPGAAGNHGWHQVITLLRFDIEAGRVQNLEVVELGTRTKIQTTEE